MECFLKSLKKNDETNKLLLLASPKKGDQLGKKKS